jgi:hypothetical protein
VRRLVVLTLLAACGKPAASSGPAWPKSAGWEPVEDWKEDGGESIEPRNADDVAAIESSDDPVPAGSTETTVEVTPEPPPADAPTPPPAVEPVPDETIIIEGELPPDAPADPPPVP